MGVKKVEVIEKGFQRFQKHNRSKNLAEKTIKFYKQNYKKFNNYIEDLKINKLENITAEVIEDYRLHLKNELESGISVNTYLRGIRAFLYYCMENEWMEKYKIEMIKVEEKKKRGYTKKQLKRLLKKPDMKNCSFPQYRNWVIVNFLLNTAVRASSLINIKINDLNLINEEVTITHTKGRREMTLPLSSTMINILEQYLKIREGEDKDYLFPNIYGNKLTRGGLSKAIKNYNNKRGIDRTSLHDFRHSFSRIFIKNGGTISQLRRILGHKDISTTDKYVRLLIGDIKKNYDSINPLECLSENKKNSIRMKKNEGNF